MRAIKNLLILAIALGGAARAEDVNVVSFRPSSGSDGLVATEGARPLRDGEGRFEVRLWLDAAYQPVQVPGALGSSRSVVQNRVGGWFGVNMFLIGPFSLAAQLPVTMNEFGDFTQNPTGLGQLSTVRGIGDLRLTPRLSVLRQELDGINLALQGSVELPTATSMSLTTDTKANGEILLAVSRMWAEDDPRGAAFEAILNAYARYRDDRQLAGQTIGSGAGARLGAIVHTGDQPMLVPQRVFGELDGMTWSSSFKETATPVEWRAGLGWCLKHMSLDLSGGTHVTNGIGAAEGRFMAGIGYAPNRCGTEENRIMALREKERARKDAIAAAALQRRQDELAAEELRARIQREIEERQAAELRRLEQERAAAEAKAREPTPLVTVREQNIVILERVHFAEGKAKIDPQSHAVLNEVARLLQERRDIAVVEIQGHTCDQGSAATNRHLSQRRAEAVMKYLVDAGVDRGRLIAKGYGQATPIASNATAEGRELNRRVEFKIVELAPPVPGT